MDAYPWTYRVAAAELAREHKIDPAAPAGSGTIPDPRRYAYIEACGELSSATAIAFDFGVDHQGRTEWYSTDREVPQFRIARSGCFQAAAPLPDGVRLSAAAPPRVRVRAHRKVTERDAPRPEGPISAKIVRVNSVFMLDEDYRPRAVLPLWMGSVTVGPDAPVELPR
jgi:hypothetical protein